MLKDSDQNAEKKPYGYKQLQTKEETKDFTKLKNLEKTIGTFGEEEKDDEESKIVDEETHKQIKELAESEDLQGMQYDLTSERSDIDVRVAVIGNVDSGKSTLVGVLTK